LPLGRSQEFLYGGTTARVAAVTTNDLLRPVTHDSAGNERSFVIERTYSPRNLLQEVIEPSEPGEQLQRKLLYSYDGRGIRVVRGESPGNSSATVAQRYYFYTPELKHLAVTHDDTSTTRPNHRDLQYAIVWFGDRPVAQIPPSGGRRYTFTDHLGTPIMQTDSAATSCGTRSTSPSATSTRCGSATAPISPCVSPGRKWR
jgi:hypothetical protein